MQLVEIKLKIMIYKDVQNLIHFSDQLIAYIENDSEANHKENVFGAIIFLFHIEELFDMWGRNLFRDEADFDLQVSEDKYEEIRKQITESMDKIRSKMEGLVDKYGREKFKEEYGLLKKDAWINRL